MYIKNLHTGLPEPVDIGDILYSYFELYDKNRNRQKTWSFRCQGLLSTMEHDYILGPGNSMFLLGVDCFSTNNEAIAVGYILKDRKKKERCSKYKLVLMTDDEKVRI